MDRVMQNNLTERIKKILNRYLGGIAANSALKINCEKIGINPDSLRSTHITRLLDKLRITLLIFFEEEKVNDILTEIRNIVYK